MTEKVSSGEAMGYLDLLSNLGVRDDCDPRAVLSGRIGWCSEFIDGGIGFGALPFKRILELIRRYGDDEAVFVNLYSPESSRLVIKATLGFDEFKQVFSEYPDLAVFDSVVIGSSGKWVILFQGLSGGEFFFSKYSI